ncbi:hypothetical protein H6F51_18045 [Cyanobacteria bacterium FACHB-DQ100]|nr:hypothetical protein [Cyanobacteria bacterium FACHB-DQ100]
MKTASVKLWSAFFSTLALCCSSIPAMALPLQEGMYRIGSKYIQISANGDRLCYQGLSARGSTTASIGTYTLPDFYVVNFKTADSKETLVLHQPTIGNLLFGTLHNLASWEADYQSPRSQNDAMKRCLGSQSPFIEQSTSSR